MTTQLNIPELISTPTLFDGAGTDSAPPELTVEAGSLSVHTLKANDEREVLAFLAARPVHTVLIAGFIRDNGLENQSNRGTFYGCRNREGQLEGVALIGHATLFETRTEAALAALAYQARRSRPLYMITAEREKVERFWHYYDVDGVDTPRQIAHTLMMEQALPTQDHGSAPGLRLADLDDLDSIIPVNAQMIYEEHGINPLELDPAGFRLRCASRIEKGKILILAERGRLIFKADVASLTPEAAYIEGIFVSPEEQGKGVGLRCISQLGKNLAGQTKSICGLVNVKNKRAQAFYYRSGYELRGDYHSIFLEQ